MKSKVLVVDDSSTSVRVVSHLIKKADKTPISVFSLAQALDVLNDQASDEFLCAVVDYTLPDAPRGEAIEAVLEYNIPVIGMSSEGPSFLSARFIKSGANDYLNRPYCHEEFFCCVTQNIENIENIEAIRRAANSDYLTGLPNRRYFFHRLENTTSSAQDCVALIDLDFFKKVNDTFGHEGGDQVLKDVARLLASHFSQHLIARFGGEEFCVYFQNTPVEQAKASLEVFRIAFSERASWINQQPIKCTTSIGLSNKFEGEIDGMISLADLALYQAKKLGRNQIVVDELQANAQTI
ncbi:diguanylate cyclase [Paraglaciecola chathamensis]|uniref:GGDEF domain-containing response regulator n=1 Tax=Paraglaciecola chathamensis TaxID=368405 RepID=UPI00270CE717|nr:diguanylate cyclase [Paraglaciecola chathamensis]MDO6839513.1 diguanylate cyclase [Paraglaciecola chathamensis]